MTDLAPAAQPNVAAPTNEVEPKETKVQDTVLTGNEVKPEENLVANPQEPAKPEIPEKYELKMPDGYVLEGERMEVFDAFAREAGLTNESAQKAVDLFINTIPALIEEKRLETIKQWGEELKAVPEFAGSKFAESVGVAREAVQRFGGDAFAALLNETGLGNHPVVAKVFLNIGLATAEAAIANQTSANGAKSVGAKLWPNLPASNPS